MQEVYPGPDTDKYLHGYGESRILIHHLWEYKQVKAIAEIRIKNLQKASLETSHISHEHAVGAPSAPSANNS